MSLTIKDIARLAGVSTATVSRVVNGFEKVSDETRSRILALISESDYRPNVNAIELVRGRRRSSKSRVMSKTSVVDCEVRRDLRRRFLGQERSKKVEMLKRENIELRSLLENLYEQIPKWQVRESSDQLPSGTRAQQKILKA